MSGGNRLDLTKLNHRHEQIVNWLIMNPDKSQGECARAFGYTEPWLSRLISSDLFQAKLRARQGQLGDACVHLMENKLRHLANLSLDQSIRLVESGKCSERFLGETRDSVLARIGFGTQQTTPEHKHVHLHVDGETLIRAREKARGTIAAIEGCLEQGEKVTGVTP